MDKLRFISLASGSSGNCYYLGTACYGILIDAGIGPRTIKKRLKEVGIPFEHIQAVFVTHDHVDHIKSVGVLGEKYHLPVYATRLVHEGINRCYGVTEKLNASKRFLETGVKIELRDFELEAFPVSHDSSDSVGYTLYYKGKRFTIATDLGYICENAAAHISKANYLVIEANYDEKMLLNGFYPPHLKTRVSGKQGHMDNRHTGDFLANNYHEDLDFIYLCHLSKENNTPELAVETISSKMREKNILVGEDVQLVALARTTPSVLYVYDS